MPNYSIQLGIVYRRITLGATMRLGFQVPKDYGYGSVELPRGIQYLAKGLSGYGYLNYNANFTFWDIFSDPFLPHHSIH